ncbi:MAG TPA: O-methyltransferase [Actinomycetota bacterium]|jgi:caffeoyl-CoA O-methyltransferase|nr:O-methyltransferase [Actinomycetota bacterium]
MDIVNPDVEAYMASLQARHDEPVLLEMEKEGRERDFPIVGRNVGVTLEVLARSINARLVMELGSGFGYSAYWFARAVGEGGEVHCTDGEPANAAKAEAYLERAGLANRVSYHVGDAVEQMATVEGVFDIVYDDIDKDGYPDAWRAARERIRVGGFYICDNVLWSGRVVEPGPDRNTSAILEHNKLIADDDRFVSTIVPTRDGVFVALRVA